VKEEYAHLGDDIKDNYVGIEKEFDY